MPKRQKYIKNLLKVKELKVAKKIITQEVEKFGFKVEKIILFGSRARGDFSKDSDWDFLVIVDKDASLEETRELRKILTFKLLKLGIIPEILVKSESSFLIERDISNTISYSASREGVEI